MTRFQQFWVTKKQLLLLLEILLFIVNPITGFSSYPTTYTGPHLPVIGFFCFLKNNNNNNFEGIIYWGKTKLLRFDKWEMPKGEEYDDVNSKQSWWISALVLFGLFDSDVFFGSSIIMRLFLKYFLVLLWLIGRLQVANSYIWLSKSEIEKNSIFAGEKYRCKLEGKLERMEYWQRHVSIILY